MQTVKQVVELSLIWDVMATMRRNVVPIYQLDYMPYNSQLTTASYTGFGLSHHWNLCDSFAVSTGVCSSTGASRKIPLGAMDTLSYGSAHKMSPLGIAQ